jgi:Family of unknown function (DUF6348)
MKRLLAALLFVPKLAFGAQGAEYVAAYVQSWLKEHRVESVVGSDSVVSVSGKGLQVSGEVLQAQDKGSGTFIVETKVRISLPNSKVIEENVAGIGGTAEKAFIDSLRSFCLTTLHPMYAEFIDSADSHVARRVIDIGGKKRTVFLTDWAARGDRPSSADMDSLLEQTFASLNELRLDDGPHWAKLIAYSSAGKMQSIVLTVDNQSEERATEKLHRIRWPETKNLYVLKLFVVVGAVKAAPGPSGLR